MKSMMLRGYFQTIPDSTRQYQTYLWVAKRHPNVEMHTVYRCEDASVINPTVGLSLSLSIPVVKAISECKGEAKRKPCEAVCDLVKGII